ncbi:hypothetical protein SAMN05444161_6844 [Rhizobiales bacterium GAS191]|jgi:hypothetical protein|nr:hypothetical protein SAMN05519103_08965 [Rhizobiales bacterium GAS113]SEE71721.1 hypothetical protein SAMN05444161_6844 [Rhizobiales bacterium GAS191]SEF02566.1 hypothetical protein SAMN05519104_7876 [Rhizobiales bacterium GAS188]
MADEFTVENLTEGWIEVRQMAFGHVYRFSIVEAEHDRRKLADSPRTENEGAKRESAFYALQARVFAERMARKAGLID